MSGVSSKNPIGKLAAIGVFKKVMSIKRGSSKIQETIISSSSEGGMRSSEKTNQKNPTAQQIEGGEKGGGGSLEKAS